MQAVWELEQKQHKSIYMHFFPLTFEETTHLICLLRSRLKKGPKKEAWEVVYLYFLKSAFVNVWSFIRTDLQQKKYSYKQHFCSKYSHADLEKQC